MGQLLSNSHQIALFLTLLFASKRIRYKPYNSISSMKVKEVSILDRFQLQNVKLKSSILNPHQEIVLQKQSSSPLSKERIPNLLVLSLKVTITESLNNCLKSKAIICTVWLNSFCICLFLHTREGEYCFDEMNYYMFAETTTNTLNEVTLIEVESVEYSFKKTEIGLKISYNRKGDPFPELEDLNEITLETGFRDLDSYLRGEITEFRVQTIFASEPLPSSAKCQNKFYFIDKQYSSPIGVISNLGQIYTNLGLKKLESAQIDKLIAQLPHFSSPLQKQGRLYLCHDMKNGYTEDVDFENNVSLNSKPLNFEYRSFYLEQSNIFNYFSHHNITIPPKHWRIACKRYKTKCLGTFIIEQPVFIEQVLTSPQFALFLVAIAKKVQFDGYLINIQTKINSLIPFKKWLDYLTRKMHEHIPNSQVIWYDSISAVNGAINYQNALTSVNKEFYMLTDGIFTNYWWNEGSLKTSITNKQGKNVYMGNDCFGRNTYGGGKYDIYKAANKILEYKSKLQIALFAPGYTYQNNAEDNRVLYQLNELSMYKGLKTQTIIIDKWRDIINRGNGWGQEGDWATTSYEVCERSAYFKFQPLLPNTKVKVQFMYNIKGTPPIKDSPYKVVIQVLDQNNNIVAQTEANNFTNSQKAPQKQQTRSIQIDVDAADLVGPFTVRVIEMGKSSEQWAGQYGPRFKSEMVMVMIYEKEKHWIAQIPIIQQVIGKSWHSSFNVGYGDSFFYDGVSRQSRYGYLADFDHPHTHIINHPLDTDFYYKQAFLGGSSLKVKKQSIHLLKLIIPSELDLSPQYFLQVTVKDTPKIELTFKYISKLEEERVFQAAFHNLEEINGWKRFTFKMGTSIKQVKQDIRSILEIRSVQYPYLIGEVKIVPVRLAEPAEVQVQVHVSRDYYPTASHFLNFTFKSNGYERLLLKSERYAAYAYFTNGTAFLRNIPFTKIQPIQFQIVDTDLSLNHHVLRTATIDPKIISQSNMPKSVQI